MLQGAVVAVVFAAVLGALEHAGVGGPGSADAAAVFLLVGAALVATFLATRRPRR
jgi:hypothetical protein